MIPAAIFCNVPCSQSDCQANGTDGGNNRGRLDAELTEHHYHDKAEHHIACDLGKKPAQCQVEAADLPKPGIDPTLDETCDNESDDQQ